jgi:hypothetical protein
LTIDRVVHECSAGEGTINRPWRRRLRHLDEASAAAEVVPRLPGDATPALPSPDQKFFNESLRAGVRGLGELVRNRKKKK